jgi:small-conductance mechanosensitive channel
MEVIATLIVILMIYIVYRIIVRMIKKVPEERMRPQTAAILEHIAKYLFYICCGMYILGLFGIKFSAIWGAAGVAGLAIGFAAQTSVSNVISGLFILTEHTMKVGDVIDVGGVTGVVDSIDLLSIKVHTPDNQRVRIPNSSIINSNLINTSFYPQRRMTINVSVSYDTDMKKALETLAKAAACCPTVLKDPAPAAWFDSFGDSSINLVAAVWFKSADYLQTRNDMFIAIKTVFDKAGIDIPFNRLDVSVLNDIPAVPAKTRPAGVRRTAAKA